MITEHQIRLSQADHPQDEPETKASGIWMYGVLAVAVVAFAYAVYRAGVAWMAV
ncbi:hypothetical protein [Mesorhizobium ciceri]|uniref:hypothetical protein n=1 Tax=Mesorhizobium TaxID=68287 RepID=UPI0012DD2F6D|nr:hypothetical protein [Mesorhizobium ciceri]